MRMLSILAIALLSFALIGMQAHASPPSYGIPFYAFLNQYVQHSAVNSSIYYNKTIGNDTYVVMDLSQNDYVIVNTTMGAYSFVLDNSTAYAILRPIVLARYYPNSSTLNSLNAYMLSYQLTAQPPLSDCLVETGLSSGLTCTIANGCQSCQTVPVCRKFLAATNTYNASTTPSGAVTPTNLAVFSISNFSTEYGNLNSSYNSYYSLLSKITPDNSYQTLQLLQNNVKRVSNISTYLPRNPIFPVPQGFNPSNFSTCTSYVTTQAPWYCNAVGYCRSVSFNSTKLYLISATLTNLLELPLSNASIQGVSDNATLRGFSFLEPLLQQSLSSVLAANYARYNATTANATTLLTVYYNTSLSNSLIAIQGTFKNLVSYNFHINASTYNSTLSGEFDNLSFIYIPLNAQYQTLKAISTNNTALVLQRELEYQSEPVSLASLAYAQQSINDLLVSGINSSQYASVYAQLKSTQSGLNAVGAPISMPATIKAIDGGIVSSILAGSNASIPSKLAAAPLYVFLITLAISIAVILVLYLMTFHRLKRKSRLHLHPAARRAWVILFVVLFVIAIAFSYLTSAYAAQANTFLPIDGFQSQITSHNTIFIAFNGTNAAANQSIRQCAAAINQTLSNASKTIDALVISNYTCLQSSSNPYCLDQILASGDPVIVLSQSPISSVTYRGMYGQTLYAGGEAVSGSECYLNGILKVG